ncbi:MAG: hypothetical protein ACOC44_12410 [Promethearchaeia archaeon]
MKSKYVEIEDSSFRFRCTRCGHIREKGEIFYLNMKDDEFLCKKCKKKEVEDNE